MHWVCTATTMRASHLAFLRTDLADTESVFSRNCFTSYRDSILSSCKFYPYLLLLQITRLLIFFSHRLSFNGISNGVKFDKPLPEAVCNKQTKAQRL